MIGLWLILRRAIIVSLSVCDAITTWYGISMISGTHQGLLPDVRLADWASREIPLLCRVASCVLEVIYTARPRWCQGSGHFHPSTYLAHTPRHSYLHVKNWPMNTFNSPMLAWDRQTGITYNRHTRQDTKRNSKLENTYMLGKAIVIVSINGEG